jgi:hypothetical protein
VGEQVANLGTATQEGDCLALNTSNLTVVPPADVGPDGIPCTDDDEVAQGADGAAVPLTTGSAQAFLVDAIGLGWAATCSEGRVGDSCLENSNCDTLIDPNGRGDGVCNTDGSSHSTLFSPLEVGQRGDCSDLESSNLAGLRLVSAVPFADGSGLGDGAFTLRFVCE